MGHEAGINQAANTRKHADHGGLLVVCQRAEESLVHTYTVTVKQSVICWGKVHFSDEITHV